MHVLEMGNTIGNQTAPGSKYFFKCYFFGNYHKKCAIILGFVFKERLTTARFAAATAWHPLAAVAVICMAVCVVVCMVVAVTVVAVVMTVTERWHHVWQVLVQPRRRRLSHTVAMGFHCS